MGILKKLRFYRKTNRENVGVFDVGFVIFDYLSGKIYAEHESLCFIVRFGEVI